MIWLLLAASAISIALGDPAGASYDPSPFGLAAGR